MAKLSRAWKYHKNADQTLGARMSYVMIAQSMFLLSYVTLYLVAAGIWWPPSPFGCLPPFNWASRISGFGTHRGRRRWRKRRSGG